MKNRLIATILFSSAVIAAPAFAGSAYMADEAVAPRVQTQAQLHAQQSTVNAQNDQNGPGKTRAQVYQELIDAQRSGELARANQTYRGS